ncbi:MAG: DUF2461 domain-containing protein [Proteobacteria bacterium]|nr:DUF2461 domain-containing protein [Pseudomonadota bacterium]
MARYAGFEERTIRFLDELKANNDRDWFGENKSRYEEDVLDVAVCLKPQFQRTVETSFRNAEAFMRFLCKAVGVSF